MSVTTVKVSNLSLGASERDVKEFFSFSGDIEYVEMRSDTERSQIAFVTFKDAQGAETAVLLSRTKEKVVVAEDEQRRKMVDDFAQVHLSESPKGSDSDESKPAPVQGLIL
ncbi:RNA-binding (RRM/RBD/RNP motifs) family protein [Striga hermonthica]|uniref:RNA-binding (RRM/RBD/RNP motifs) family protein n=1 Tax=Striga hermonthica TaxID=68872 RepID=A0A9N7NX17_STRHE|nr:RNA-binding (RRM/RBD/RNP motifs) family protein [Striga hermonthica]